MTERATLEIYRPPDEATYREAVDRLIGIVKELAVLRADEPDPDLDAPFANAVMVLVSKRELPGELDAGALCREALPLLSDGERARAAKMAGQFLYRRGDVESASACLELGLAASAPPAQRALILTDLAQYRRRMGRWEAGLAAADEALQLADGQPPDLRWYIRGHALGARTQNLIGQGALNQARAALAEEHAWVLAPSLAARIAAGAVLGVEPPRHPYVLAMEAGLLLHQVDVFFGSADPRSAHRLVTRELEADRALPVARAFAMACQGIALGEMGRIEPERSRGWYFEEAETILAEAAEQPGMSPLEGLQTELARVDYALLAGDDERADRVLARARALADEIGTGLGALEGGALLAATEARIALRRGASDERLAELDVALGESFHAFLDSWSQARIDGELAYLRSNRRREIVWARIALSVARGRQEQAFGELLSVQGYGSLARSEGIEVPGIDELRATLIEDDHGVLVYLPAPSGGHVFALDDDELVHHALPPGNVVNRACSALRGALDVAADGKGEEELAAAVRDVSALVFPPEIAARVRRWKRVTVVGSVYFFDIPFECLLDPAPESGGAWLGEVRAVDSLPTLPVGMLLASRPSARRDGGLRLLVSADPGARARAERPKLRAIPVTAKDLERLTAPFEGAAVVAEGVTPSSLRAMDLSSAAIVHVLSHGIYESTATRAGPALVLEPDEGEVGLLRPADLRELELSGLVLLSACEAGRGPVYWGNDLSDELGCALLEAGARAVLRTGARVLYRDALEFMEHVTRALAQGVPLAEASRRARAELGGVEAETSERVRRARFGVLGLGQR